MASYLIDEDMARQTTVELRLKGHTAVTVQELSLKGSGDELILLTAAQQARILVTHNAKDFTLLHKAWLRWQVSLPHGGILIVPQSRTLLAPEIARIIAELSDSGVPVINRLYRWRPHGAWSSIP